MLLLTLLGSPATAKSRCSSRNGQPCMGRLLTDPLERRPPVARLPFSLGGERLELALDAAAVRQRWQQAFDAPMQEALALLQRQRIRAQPLSSDDPADAWLALLDGPAGRAM